MARAASPTRWLVGLFLAALIAPCIVLAESLGSAEIRIVGLTVNVDTRPDVDGVQTTMTAVKGFPTAVQTLVGVPGVASLPGLPSGAMVKAELTGPALGNAAVTLVALPNQPMDLPPLGAAGDYVLRNVRLEDGQGNVLLHRDPTLEPVLITVIDRLLVTQVTSRPLTLKEIQDKGIVIDESSFTALNFTVGLTLGSERVVIDLPVVVPRSSQAGVQLEAPKFARIGGEAQQFRSISIPNFSLAGFSLLPPPELDADDAALIPPINGVMVIPGNIAFLHQFFSVILQATNVAPADSALVVRSAAARIVLPPGEDRIANTGDDPLGVARTQTGGGQEDLPLFDRNGSDAIVPQGANQAEFLVEGRREGTHEVTFDLRGDLFVPALGKTVAMRGKAVGVVQVKNPTYSIVLAHPDVVREGEAYALFATVTNTSTTPANLFKLALSSRALSGARLAEGESPVRQRDSLLPGESATFAYRLVARTTGQVTGTVFLADESINGSFVLTTGVGDTGIPLSPDTLILPQTVDFLPKTPDLVAAVVRLLGQAYSVATAPAGALPPEMARISKPYVFDRAVKLAQTGLHVGFGEAPVVAVQDLLMDYLGNDLQRLASLFPNAPVEQRIATDDLRAFDKLRRAAGAGENFSAVAGALLGTALADSSLAELQRDWATLFASRPAFLSFGASSRGSPVFMELRDDVGNRLGHLDPSGALQREVPFAARLPLMQSASGSTEILLVAAPTAPAYDLTFAVPEGAADVELVLVVPEGEGRVLVTYPAVTVSARGFGSLRWRRDGANSYVVDVDTNADGVVDLALTPTAIEPVEDLPPTIVSVLQWAKGNLPASAPTFESGDPLGRMVGVLFSEEVSRASAEPLVHYNVAQNTPVSVALQPDRRLAFVVLDRPTGPFVARDLTVRQVEDVRGNRLGVESLPIRPDPARGTGGRFTGQVVTADGRPVPFAPVKYIQPLFQNSLFDCFPKDFVVSTYEADASGQFAIDFVLQSGFRNDEVCTPDIWLNQSSSGGTNHFKIEANDPATGEVGRASTRVQFDAQHLDLRVIIRGFGAIEGFVFNEEGQIISGGDPHTPESLAVLAMNLSTGEAYVSWVDANGFYAFPRTFERPNGDVVEAPRLAVGNVALQILRPSDGFTGVVTMNLPAAGVKVKQDIVMFPPFRFGTVSGRVLEADGTTPAPNVLVQLAGQVLTGVSLTTRSTAQGVIASGSTDAHGTFRFAHVPAGDIEVRAFRQATFEEASAVSFLTAGAEESLILVFPGRGGTVRGIVRDALGALITGATVAGGPSLATTDAQGTFEIHGLPLGTFTIFGRGTSAPSVGSITVSTAGPNDVQEVVITLEPVGSLVGSVFKADGVTPILAQKVQLWLEPNRGVVSETFSDVNGAYRFQNFPLGRYSVRAIDRLTLDGGMTLTDIRFAGDVRDADVVFRGLGTIHGRVLQDNGTPAIADILITRKVWKILTDSSFNAALGLQSLEQFAQIPGLSETVQRTIEENRLNATAAEFFVLSDETVHGRSDVLGPGGEVTGTFAFTGPAAAGPFTVAAIGPFLAPAEVRGEIPRTTNPAERLVDVGDIMLTPVTGSVQGTVFLPDGQTPVGANVRVKLRSLDNSGTVLTTGGAQSQPVLPEIDVLTDADGKFAFPLVLRGNFVLSADTGAPEAASRADSPGAMQTEAFADAQGNRLLNVHLFGQAKGSVPAGETLIVDIRLLDVAGVRVRVVESDGVMPVDGARVTLSTASNLDQDPGAAFTDASGAVDFFPVLEGMFSVGVTVPGDPRRGSATGAVPVNPPNGLEIPITVRLGAVTTASGQIIMASVFGSVTGQVFKSDGTPLLNPAQVTVQARGAEILTSTDNTGHYLAENVPGGFFRVDVFEPFTARRGAAPGTLTQDGQVVTVDVTLVGLGTVAGEVFNNDGSRMLAGVDLFLLPSGNFSDRLVSRTDPQGFYTLAGVPLGLYTVQASDPHSGLTGDATGVMARDGDVNTTDVFLAPSGTITGLVYAPGVVVDGLGHTFHPDGTPFPNAPTAAGAAVTIRRGSFTQTVQASADGLFTSGAFLPIGTYTLTVRALTGNDGARTTAKISTDSQVVSVAVALRGTGTVAGVVLDSAGVAPVLGTSVTLASASEFNAGASTRITDTAGRFAFDAVPVGAFSLSVQTNLQVPPLGGVATAEVEFHSQAIVFADGDDDVEHHAIRLENAGAILGRVVLDDAATPAEGAIVLLSGGAHRLTRRADGTGSFRFDGIPLGSYALAVLEPGTNGVAARTVTLALNGAELDLGTLRLDSHAPAVVSTLPSNNQVGVSPVAPIVVTFTEPMAASSLSPGTFQVRLDGQPVAGTYNASAHAPTVIFIPAAPFPDLKRVAVTLRGDVLGFEGQVLEPGIRDLAGLGLAGDSSFSFTTGDSTPPAVVSLSPAADAVQVALESVVRLEFGEPIDPASVRSFTLTLDGTLVAGVVNSTPILGGRVVVFTPNAPLLPNHTYTAILTGPVRDLAGNIMTATSITWSFETLDTLAPIIQALRVPAGVALVQGSTVQVTAELAAASDVAAVEFYRHGTLVSTATGAPFTHALFLDPGLGTSVSLAAVAIDPLGNRSAQALLALVIAANQPPVVHITSPGDSTVSVGQVVSVQVASMDDAGLSQFGFTAQGGSVARGVQAVAAALTAQGSFSLTIPSALPFGSTVVLQATATDILGVTTTSGLVTLTVGDALPPTVTIGSPANHSAFDPGAEVTVFVRADDVSGIREIRLNTSGGLTFSETRALDSVTSPAAATFVFRLPPILAPTDPVVVSARAVDAAGNTSPETFITLRVNDKNPPVVTLAVRDGATQVVQGDSVTVTVSATDEVGVASLGFAAQGGLTSAGTQSITPVQASAAADFVLTMPSTVPAGNVVTVVGTAQDAAGNTSTSTTMVLLVVADQPPTVALTSPIDGSAVVEGAPLTLSAEASDDVGVTQVNFRVDGVSVGIDTVAPYTVQHRLSLGTGEVPVIIEASATDTAGQTARHTVTIIQRGDLIPPKVAGVVPADGATDVAVTTSIQVTFSEPIDPATVTPVAFSVWTDATAVPGAFSLGQNNTTVRFTPGAPLPFAALITMRLTAGITDTTGNALTDAVGQPLAQPLTFTFTTGSFGIASPGAGSHVLENTAIQLEARGSAALNITTVTFVVNGQSLPAVSGTPFIMPFTTPAAATSPTLTIAAIARTSNGTQVAQDQVVIIVLPALHVEPRLVGIPLGSTRTLRLVLSSPLATDLAVDLRAVDPEIVTLPAALLLPAGQTAVSVTVTGSAVGKTTVLASSSPGTAEAVVSVSEPVAQQELTALAPGVGLAVQVSPQELTALAPGVGLAVQASPSLGQVLLGAGGETTVGVRLLAAPATAETPVSLVSSNPAVVNVVGPTSIAAGSQVVILPLRTGPAGDATLRVQAGTEVRQLTVVVGEPSAARVPLTLMPPVGLAIRMAGMAGTVFLDVGSSREVVLRLLSAPATADTLVLASTANPQAATVAPAVFVLPAGQQDAVFTVSTGNSAAETLIALQIGAEARTLLVVGGIPGDERIPLTLAPPVGLEVDE